MNIRNLYCPKTLKNYLKNFIMSKNRDRISKIAAIALVSKPSIPSYIYTNGMCYKISLVQDSFSIGTTFLIHFIK